MNFVVLSRHQGIAEVLLRRGKVNAINEDMVEEIAAIFQTLAAERDINAVILTAEGPFFSFGFDIPEFLSCSRDWGRPMRRSRSWNRGSERSGSSRGAARSI